MSYLNKILKRRRNTPLFVENSDIYILLYHFGKRGVTHRVSCDIMYTSLFKTLQLTEKNLSPYVESELYAFNDSSTQPWGYVQLLVTFGEGEAKKTIPVPFLVIDCLSLYNCIIGRTRLALRGAACSTAHLKLKYHAKDDIIASLNGGIEAAKRCFLQANKS